MINKKFRVILAAILIFLAFSIKAGDGLFPELKGWKLSGEFQKFDQSNLFDYINGAADTYFAYEFEEVTIARYVKGKSGIKAEIYTHSGNNNGFGIYGSERFPDYHFIDVGGQAYTTGGALNMVCGRYYVKLFAENQDEEEQTAIFELAGKMSEILDTENQLPAELKLFPEENKIKYSEQFINSSFLGYEFLSKAFTADYSNDGQAYRIFIIVADSRESAETMITKYLQFTKQNDLEIREGKFLITDKYNGNIPAVWKEKYIVGCLNLEDENVAQSIISAVLSNIK